MHRWLGQSNWILTMGFLTKMNVSVGCIGILNLVLNKIDFLKLLCIVCCRFLFVFVVDLDWFGKL
jgi:hypothetical protein